MKRLRRCGLKKTKPVRAVIDTNLFISGLFAGHGHTFELQELWISGSFELVVSVQILDEIQRTLQKPQIRQRLQLIDGEEALIVDLIKQKAAIVTTDSYQTDKITEDPTDNKFLACALEADVDYIVSGDNHLLSLKHFHRIQIVDVATFIEKVKTK
jgi:putative PIN family toxin of toxin-antitoxin system